MTSTADPVRSDVPRKLSVPGEFPGSFQSLPPTPTISSQRSLAQAVYDRREEYTRPYHIRVKVGTWNVASLSGTEKDIEGWFVKGKGVSDVLAGLSLSEEDQEAKDVRDDASPKAIEDVIEQENRRTKKESTIPRNDPGSLPGDDEIGLYALGLQEIVDISSATQALRPFTDPYPSKKWKDAVSAALPAGYELVAEQQLMGLLLLIYASPTVAPTISEVSTTSVGTGLMGYMGNKGGVTTRIVLGETTRIVFVNCHLAAGNEKGSVERRNWDASQIVTRTKFTPLQDGGGVVEEFGEGIGDADFAFWFGDLNYRLDSMAGDDVRRLLMVHTRNEYDTMQASLRQIDQELEKSKVPSSGSSDDSEYSSSDVANGFTNAPAAALPNVDQLDPASDPASLQTTLSSLLAHDQLYQQMRSRKAFHDGWKEGPITFVPTYKYDVGSVGMFDSSEKRRGPSWCDRILYRTRKDQNEYREKCEKEAEARRRDEEMKARGLDKPVDDDVLFDYDPDADGAEEGEYEPSVGHENDSEVVITKAGYKDRLHLDYYTSHQRVLSSDHKPLDAVFALTYEAVDPELKAHVHQDVARELDKAENEARPAVTIVFEHVDDNSNDEIVSFGEIRYDSPVTRNITIANTGRVPASFGFIDRHTAGICPSWLDIHFDRASSNDNLNASALHHYNLEPGEVSTVELTIHVTDMADVHAFNEGSRSLDDVLVLRVDRGRDHFISIGATWLPSVFGRSLDDLTRIPEGGIRQLANNGTGNLRTEPVKWSAPRELFRLTGAIEELVERAVAEWGMREESEDPPWIGVGWPFVSETWAFKDDARKTEQTTLNEALDLAQPFSFKPEIATWQKVEVLAETLITFLETLTDGIITTPMWETICTTLQTPPIPTGEQLRTAILDGLSTAPTHSIAFTFLTTMMSRVLNELAPLHSVPPSPAMPQSPGKAIADPALRRQVVQAKLSDVFAGVMIRASLPTKAKERKAEEGRRRSVIEGFISGGGGV